MLIAQSSRSGDQICKIKYLIFWSIQHKMHFAGTIKLFSFQMSFEFDFEIIWSETAGRATWKYFNCSKLEFIQIKYFKWSKCKSSSLHKTKF